MLLDDGGLSGLQFRSERDRVVWVLLRLTLTADLGVVVVIPPRFLRAVLDESLEHLFPVDWLDFQAFRASSHLHVLPSLVILVLTGRCRVVGDDSFGFTIVGVVGRYSREGAIMG